MKPSWSESPLSRSLIYFMIFALLNLCINQIKLQTSKITIQLSNDKPLSSGRTWIRVLKQTVFVQSNKWFSESSGDFQGYIYNLYKLNEFLHCLFYFLISIARSFCLILTEDHKWRLFIVFSWGVFYLSVFDLQYSCLKFLLTILQFFF